MRLGFVLVAGTSITACRFHPVGTEDAEVSTPDADARSANCEVVSFTDPALEAAVRGSLSIPSGPILGEDLGALDLLVAVQKGIQLLDGLECATGVRDLWLDDNQIQSIAPLHGLTSLTSLEVRDNLVADLTGIRDATQLVNLFADRNPITQVDDLAGHSALVQLGLSGCPLASIDPLQELSRLALLDLSDCGLGDISALESLTRLWGLFLRDNAIDDISPLAGLLAVGQLDLSGNQIQDLGPIRHLSWAAEGNLKCLWVKNNPLDEEALTVHIPALCAEGVVVYWNETDQCGLCWTT